MMNSWNVQWLLGLAIVVVGTFLLFDQGEEVVISDQTNLPIEPETIPPPPAGLPIKPVDAKTKACMADMACMQDFFLKITLGNEYQPPKTTNPLINKWRMPLNYRVFGLDQLDPERLDSLNEGLADMTNIGSLLGLTFVPSEQEINVIVLMTSDLEADLNGRFADLADKAFRPIPGYIDDFLRLRKLSLNCAGRLSYEADGQSSYASMFIDPTLDKGWVKRCVYEEFSQMLGLFADVADDIDSLYTDQEHRRQLTEFDFLLLRLLYHPMIEPGMTRDEVIDVFPYLYRQTITAPVAEKSF